MRAAPVDVEEDCPLWSAAGVPSLERLIACAARLAGGRAVLTPAEQQLVAKTPDPDLKYVEFCRAQICGGADPLGDIYSRLRPARVRRDAGAIYTPGAIVTSMIEWAARAVTPARIVDPGTGSGRFLVAAAERFPQAALVAVDTDPVAMLLLRANAAVRGFAHRLTLNLADYRHMGLPPIDGPTLFIGNPPYVRHHDIPERWKSWFARTAARYGLKASKLAGLHIHFFLKTRELAQPGDYGAFITSAEWLDVNYGSVLRSLLCDGLGGLAIHILAPELQPFAGAITTGAITCFKVGDPPAQLRIRKITDLADLNGLTDSAQDAVPWATLRRARKWSAIVRGTPRPRAGVIELGELFRVHRGQVTGANAVWIAGRYAGPLPASVLVPTITRARELFDAQEVLAATGHLRRVIDLPVDLDSLPKVDRGLSARFLDWARRQGAHESYIARHRAAWWAVGLRDPAPVLCTYMARRPPAFVRNVCGARHINIAHGLYPRQPLPDAVLMVVIRYLRTHVRVESGRTYAGGLTKFEPKELERLHVPSLQTLYAKAETMDAR